jgi:cell division protein FtsB
VSEKDDTATIPDNPATPTMRERLGKVLGWVNGPYRAVAFAVLVVVVVLFGRDVLSTMRVSGEIRELRRRKQQLQQSIAADSTLLRNLDDPEFLERYARERYLMRRAGETVYIIKD